MKPFMRQDSAEFCAACHKVHLDVPVNNYRWFRGFNDYDNWQASGVSGQGARSFYYPAKTSTCVDCHMAPVTSDDPGHHADGTVHSHRFAAANTARAVRQSRRRAAEDGRGLPEVRLHHGRHLRGLAGGSEKTERTPMIRRAAAGDNTPQAIDEHRRVGEEADQAGPVVIRDVGQVAAPIDKAQPRSSPGSTARVDVVVRTRKIGHFFPGGTVDAFDIWLELQGKRRRRHASSSGAAQVERRWQGRRSKRARTSTARYQLDGTAIRSTSATRGRRAACCTSRLIPPGAADIVHYRVQDSEGRAGADHVHGQAELPQVRALLHAVRLRRRAEAGSGSVAASPRITTASSTRSTPANIPKNVSGEIKDEIPELPITVLAQATASMPIGDGKTPTVWTPVVAEGRSRALERLGHRAAAAGRSERRRVRLHARSPKPSPDTPTAGSTWRAR